MIECIHEIHCSVLIIGIGNVLLRGEGFGPCVVRALENTGLLEYIELLDRVTAGGDSLDFVCDRRKVIVIDAVEGDLESGAIVRLGIDDLETMPKHSVSSDKLGIGQTLTLVRQALLSIFLTRGQRLSAGLNTLSSLNMWTCKTRES